MERKILALIAPLILLSAFAMAQKPAAGVMEPGCGFVGIAQSVVIIKLTRVPGKPKKEHLNLEYSPRNEEKRPIPADAERCDDHGQCDITSDAEITFDKISKQRASGTYHIRYHDGHEEAGRFWVARREPDLSPICE
jgi:hypothetical protein